MHTKFQSNTIRFEHSNMAVITVYTDFQYLDRFPHLSYYSLNWTKLEANLSKHSHKTYIHSNHLLKVVSWIYRIQINPNMITKHLIHSNISQQATCVYFQFNQLIYTQLKWSTHYHTLIYSWWSSNSKIYLNYLQAIKYIINSSQLNKCTCMLKALWTSLACHDIGLYICKKLQFLDSIIRSKIWILFESSLQCLWYLHTFIHILMVPKLGWVLSS